ncbi:transcriptional regulator LeuO [Salmonella enterica subsp. enterica serovar Choleraesuis]|nr:transcriptional regulator LeuO [Salmonella enterica subsp. enterica serovar Choleraesuis]
MDENVDECTLSEKGVKPQLRTVDLNLLTVFDAVMQVKNITRAAHMLGMSQPAVSNAVSRLKTMFQDELFVRAGRGIQPTSRAYQLFDSVRQALQLIQSELPGEEFDPTFSEREFHICVYSPLDTLLTSQIYNRVKAVAPNIHLSFKSSLYQNTEHQLRCQQTDFAIGYDELHRQALTCVALFQDEMVLVASNQHPRLSLLTSESAIYQEQHAVVSLGNASSFSEPWYDTPEKQSAIAYQGMALTSVINVVAQTHMVAIAPRWLAERVSDNLKLAVLPLPLYLNKRIRYLSWNNMSNRDKGHQWMQALLSDLCH